MAKIRLRFSKGGPLRFIGHLDFLKVFQQTIARAKLPVAYSQGFNPHMQLSFALPLPLGMTSVCDYADLTLESEMPEDEVISRLNAHAPGGLKLTGAREFEGPGAAALVMAADYTFPAELLADCVPLATLPSDGATFAELPSGSNPLTRLTAEEKAEEKAEEIIRSLLNRESIIIPKKTKSGIKDTDIRPDILDISISHNQVTMRLAAGSARFLNPLIVAGLLFGRDACPASITRVELYRINTNNEGLVTLYDAPIS